MSRQNSTKIVIDPEFEKRIRHTYYDSFYSKDIDASLLWRDFVSEEKCLSILKLTKGLNFRKVVEVGCGWGTNLKRLDKVKFAPELYGLEVSPSAVKYIEERTNISRLKAVYLLDTSETPFEDDFFDLGILSHVLEHVHDPKKLLKETLRTSKYVLVEVPLDDYFLYNLFDRARYDSYYGHINFFNKSTAIDLFRESGSEILKERLYRSWKVYYTDFRPTVVLKYLQSFLFYIVFLATKSRIVGTHYAALLKKKGVR
jgi:SAM-dependent methyltransferase